MDGLSNSSAMRRVANLHSRRRPLNPQKQTFVAATGISALCH
jgi:hypothetical protein